MQPPPPTDVTSPSSDVIVAAEMTAGTPNALSMSPASSVIPNSCARWKVARSSERSRRSSRTGSIRPYHEAMKASRSMSSSEPKSFASSMLEPVAHPDDVAKAHNLYAICSP